MNRKRRYVKEEFAQRGNKIFQESVRPVVEDGNKGRIVAIDIESGAYEIDDDVLAATRRLDWLRFDTSVFTLLIDVRCLEIHP